jgi:AcrR family transcriptional regulator
MKMRERLLAAGHDQVASGGWAATSVVDVALRAGVSTGALYRHFDGKGELCAEIFRAAADREVSLMREIAAGDGDARQRLASCVETFCRRALAAPTLTYALMAEPVDPAVEQARIDSKAAHRAVFAGLLAEGAQVGEWPPLDTEVVAGALVGALQEAVGLNPAGGDALVTSLVNFALQSVHADTPDRSLAP